jgi:hypothetical protein
VLATGGKIQESVSTQFIIIPGWQLEAILMILSIQNLLTGVSQTNLL